MTARYIIADVFDGIASLEDGSIDLVISSPPFLALRSYLPSDHPEKHREIGSEPTPEAFIDTLLDVVEAVTPKLAPHGTLCFELGDTYAGSGGAGGDYGEGGLREGQPTFKARTDGGRYAGGYSGGTKGHDVDGSNGAFDVRPLRGSVGWPMPKSLCLIPESFRWALVYGRNPFNGRETPRWRARNVIRWCRPNPPVGALGDKFRPATSEMVVVCKSGRRWFDLDAVREPSTDTRPWNQSGPKFDQPIDSYRAAVDGGYDDVRVRVNNPAGAPPLDWWEIPTEPYKGSHYATWPRRLLDKPILAMCPRRVCTRCGVPSERIVEREREVNGVVVKGGDWSDHGDNGWLSDRDPSNGQNTRTIVNTLGWTDCGHDSWRTGIVCDPFGGSGTTAQVAIAHGRDAVLIDLDSRNADLAVERCGMFLSVERLADERAS